MMIVIIFYNVLKFFIGVFRISNKLQLKNALLCCGGLPDKASCQGWLGKKSRVPKQAHRSNNRLQGQNPIHVRNIIPIGSALQIGRCSEFTCPFHGCIGGKFILRPGIVRRKQQSGHHQRMPMRVRTSHLKSFPG